MKKLITACILLTCMLVLNPAVAQDAEQGDLWLVTYEAVTPSNLLSYEEWNKGFMEAIDGKDMPTWYAFTEKGEYLYATNIGKSLNEGRAANDKAWNTSW